MITRAQETELEESFSAAVFALTRHFVVVEGIIVNTANAKTAFTVDVQVGGANGSTFFNVPIGVLINDQAYFIPIPVLQSDCTLGFRDGNLQRPELIKVQHVQDVLIKPAGNIIFNDGALGGMVILQNVVNRLNLIENRLNNHVTEYNTHTHISGSQGDPTGVPVIPDTDQLTPTQASDIENTKIQQ